jgi:tetratricopeptide (TPR) repeat protein
LGFQQKILFVFLSIVISACSGSKKYFKAAEKLEKQGLVNEAAEFYMESLQRKTTNVEARIKLKEVGQKYTSFMSSEFFRNYNTGRMEESIETFEKMKDFTGRAEALNVQLNYPSGYEDDYKRAIEKHCEKNYQIGEELVKQKKFKEALVYLNVVDKYKPEFKKNTQLKTTAICEPMYQSAVSFIEAKNYSMALTQLKNIHNTTTAYKDSKELYELCAAQQLKSLLMFQPVKSPYPSVAEYLFNNFSQSANQNFSHIDIINNSPFVSLPGNNIDGNIDLIQAIRKASGADYFYTYEVANRKSLLTGPTKAKAVCFQKFTYKKNDTTFVTEYRPVNYFQVKTKRSYSYDFKYKLVNAVNNQIVSFQTLTISKADEVEYNEFAAAPKGNMNDFFPYNPQSTAPMNQFNPRNWRNLFSANKEVKTEQELEGIVNQEAVKLFNQTISNYVK